MSIKTNSPSNQTQQQQQTSSDVEMARPLVNTAATDSGTPRNAVSSPRARVASPTKQMQEQKAAHSKVVSSCVLYSFCSVSMVLTNKSLASR